MDVSSEVCVIHEELCAGSAPPVSQLHPHQRQVQFPEVEAALIGIDCLQGCRRLEVPIRPAPLWSVLGAH